MSLVESAGCASKIDKATLNRVLDGLPFLDDPRVLVGAPAGDDAGVYQLDDDLALVQTVDVFSPSVDDPYTFGQIAAANSLKRRVCHGRTPDHGAFHRGLSHRIPCRTTPCTRSFAAEWTKWPRPAWPSSAGTASTTRRSRPGLP